jgi:aromatic ring-opening dioxygenase catalytic subunit (LigB family)
MDATPERPQARHRKELDMARLVGVFASSHAPLMAREWNAAPEASREAASKGFGEIAKRMQVAKPDVMIIVSPDHWVNFFYNNLPAICIGMGETHNRPPEPWMSAFPFNDIQGHPQLARHLMDYGLERGFEPSFSLQIALDHGMGIPLMHAGFERLPALIPIVVNTVEPPMLTAARCYAWGEMLRDAIDAYPGELRVAVFATGGLSHSIGEPTMGVIDEQFDHEFIRRMSGDDPRSVVRYSHDNMQKAGNGTAECRNWLIAHGAARGRGFTSHVYRPIHEWYVGCCWASWNVAH